MNYFEDYTQNRFCDEAYFLSRVQNLLYIYTQYGGEGGALSAKISKKLSAYRKTKMICVLKISKKSVIIKCKMLDNYQL